MARSADLSPEVIAQLLEFLHSNRSHAVCARTIEGMQQELVHLRHELADAKARLKAWMDTDFTAKAMLRMSHEINELNSKLAKIEAERTQR